MAKSRLSEALLSPSGKLTLSPEIVIPEPSDPTAFLLQTSAIQKLSERMRLEAKCNTAWIRGGVTALKVFCNEQEEARGNFPGPVPAIYCDEEIDVEDLSEIRDAGAEGVIAPVLAGAEISSLEDISSDDAFVSFCKSALDCGLQPIPEICIGESTAAAWKEEEMVALVETLSGTLGEDPVSVLVTINKPPAAESDDDSDDNDVESPLPKVSKALGRKVPIMGSLRVTAGGGRMGDETARMKTAGLTGALLRRECVPNYERNPDLTYVANFWSACIGDLKSTRSKTFNFRSKNNMEKSVATQWANLQADVLDSGALGDPDGPPPDLNPDNGDYQGF